MEGAEAHERPGAEATMDRQRPEDETSRGSEAMTKDEALAKYATRWWERATAEETVAFQLFEERLCCPFDVYHAAIEVVLHRPVWTHEFATSYLGALRSEYAHRSPR